MSYRTNFRSSYFHKRAKDDFTYFLSTLIRLFVVVYLTHTRVQSACVHVCRQWQSQLRYGNSNKKKKLKKWTTLILRDSRPNIFVYVLILISITTSRLTNCKFRVRYVYTSTRTPLVHESKKKKPLTLNSGLPVDENIHSERYYGTRFSIRR